MIRFFAEKADISNNSVQLSTEDISHMRSLRLRPSELFVVCDGEGTDYICKLGDKGDGSVAEIIDTCKSPGEPSVKCIVYLAFAKGDRLDYAVQKSVELGAHEVVLFISARCVSKPSDMQKKITRLQKIALETAKQSDRGRVPLISSAESFDKAISRAAQSDLPLFFYELENESSLKSVLHKTGKTGDGSLSYEHTDVERTVPCPTISIMTGPEGGFEPYEAQKAKGAGMMTASLGSRILRCETAPIAALAAIMFFYDEI